MFKKPAKNIVNSEAWNFRLHGINVAMYIVGQERRLVDPPSQWLLG